MCCSSDLLSVPGKELCLLVCLESALRAVEAPNRRHIGGALFVLCKEVVLFGG